MAALGCGGAAQHTTGVRRDLSPADVGPAADVGAAARDLGERDLEPVDVADGGGPADAQPASGDLADATPHDEDAADLASHAADSAPDAVAPPQLTCPQGMALVPAGELLVGDPARPVQLLAAVCVDLHETTAAHYNECVADGACDPYDDWPLCQTLDPERSPNQCFPDRGDHPANWLDWYRARDVCAWAGKRLPTDLQWEAAARGVDGRSFPWGEELDCTRAHWGRGRNFADCLGAGGLPDRPVVGGSYPAGDSPYGLHDAAGNLKEWVEHRVDLERVPAEDEPGTTRGGDYHEGDWLLQVSASDRSLGVGYSSQGHGVRCAAEPLRAQR